MDTAVGFVGLGAMGSGMAESLVKSGFHVRGFDVFSAALDKFKAAGGSTASSPKEAATDSRVLVIMVTTAQQAEEVLFGVNGAAQGLPDSSVVILCSTVAPGFAKDLYGRIQSIGRSIELIDAPVSGGVVKAAQGTLTIMSSGTADAFGRGRKVLEAMSENLYVVGDAPGAGSAVKMVNQLLAGVHIATSAEAMALGAKAGLDTRILFQIIKNAAGNSWMFENRVPHMLDDDYTPKSALNIFVKDLGIVLGEAQRLTFPLPLAASAHQQFLAGSAAGFGREDDAAVVKVYEKLAGVSVASPLPSLPDKEILFPKIEITQYPSLSLKGTLTSLPPEWPEDLAPRILEAIGAGFSSSLSPASPPSPSLTPLLVVLDDDPTGTQTVHGLNVLTEWSVPAIQRELDANSHAFFILTNSRALPTQEAVALTSEICKNVVEAVSRNGQVSKSGKNRPLTILLRGDSTLRGHFPEEAEAAQRVLQTWEIDSNAATTASLSSSPCLSPSLPIWVLCPFFLQGGRYSLNDVHYVHEGEHLVPAGATEFASDSAFGYKASNLREWVVEKSRGAFPLSRVHSLSVQEMREGGSERVLERLRGIPDGDVCVVNAASERDVQVFVYGMLRAQNESGKTFLCRTAASFVSTRLALPPKPPISPLSFDLGESERRGGLILVGSYVPKTSTQLEVLMKERSASLEVVMLDATVLSSNEFLPRHAIVQSATETANRCVLIGRDVLIATSRDIVTKKEKDPSVSLAKGQRISESLVAIMKGVHLKPRYVLAKGGITSSDIATKGLGCKVAHVMGQALPGVPLWRLGEESKFPGLPYIVFPGNVGAPDALAKVVSDWSTSSAVAEKADTQGRSVCKTLHILKVASSLSFSVGAFNVYSLEGIKAVKEAAEESESPAIIQIHPKALERGGVGLVSAARAVIKNAKVPLSLHFDHGENEGDVLSAIEMGFDSVMADGSSLSFAENAAFVRKIVSEAASRRHGGEGEKRGVVAVEAELGKIVGSEDGEIWGAGSEAKFTDPAQAEEFFRLTGVPMLAVCVGNVHGKYPTAEPVLDMERLKVLAAAAKKHDSCLVLHGASGLPEETVKKCIEIGVVKFNVNTEIRVACLDALRRGCLENSSADLLDLLHRAKQQMKNVIRGKLKLFGSTGMAKQFT